MSSFSTSSNQSWIRLCLQLLFPNSSFEQSNAKAVFIIVASANLVVSAVSILMHICRKRLRSVLAMRKSHLEY